VEALPVAVAIVDWRLPDGDGLALIAELRARHPSLRGILVTGFERDEAELSTRAASTDAGFFEKPVPLERLLGAIEAARPPS
jgi:DNA-binding NtrC family response regulator